MNLSLLKSALYCILGLMCISMASAQEEKIRENLKEKKSKHAFAKVFKSGDSSIRYLEWLFLEQGLSVPSQVYPISYEEVRYLMKERLDFKRLSPMGKELYQKIWDLTEESVFASEGIVAFDPVFTTSAELYFQALNEGKPVENLYRHSYRNRTPVLSFGGQTSLFDSLFIEVVAQFRQERLFLDLNPQYMSNVPLTLMSFDNFMPQEAYASYSAPYWNLQGGHGKLNFGNGKTGNLLLSDAPGELDYILGSLWSKYVRFSSLWVFLENYKPLQKKNPSTGNLEDDYIEVGGKKYYAKADLFLEAKPQIPLFFLLHRLDFKMGSRMNLALSEGVIYEDKIHNLAFLNPLYVFHNWYLTGHADYFLSLDFNITLTSFWQIYAQILADQVAAGYNRIGEGVDSIPGSIPVIFGSQVSYPLTQGYLEWIFEFVKTDPYSYLDRSSVGLYFYRRWLSTYLDMVPGFRASHLLTRVPLGYYLGNDLIRFFSQIKYERPYFFNLWLDYSLLFKGEMTLLSPWSQSPGEADKRSPSGKIRTEHAIGLGAEISLSRWLDGHNVSFKTDLTYLADFYEDKWKNSLQYGLGFYYQY